MKNNIILFVIGSIMMISQCLMATTWYVSPDGNDANNGTSWTLAKKTIQAGVNVATNSGDLVLVTNGTYMLTTQISISNAITVQSVNGAAVTIVNGNYPVTTTRCFDVNHTNAILDGFTITNGYGYSTVFGGGAKNHYGTIQNCTISGNTSLNGGGVYNNYGTVQNCTISGNTSGNGGGVYNDYGTIQNCTISGNTSVNGGGVYNQYFGTVQNCTILGNMSGNYGGGVYNTSYSTVQNCIVWNNRGNNEIYGTNFSFCCCSSIAILTNGVGNIIANPLFYDPGSWEGTNFVGGDFRLGALSPCVNTGYDMDWMTNATDLIGSDRIIGGTVDMGAYEFDPSQITNAPSAPTGVSASDGTYTDKVHVSWSYVAIATGYQIWRYTSDNSSSASQIGSSTSTNYDDTSSTAGITNYYWIKAFNDFGASGFSGSDSGYISSGDGRVSVYRLYCSGESATYEHLFTMNETETDVLSSGPSWVYEGVGWYALTNDANGSVPLYRLYCSSARQHLYTIDQTEYDSLSQNIGSGWTGEDVQYYVYSSQVSDTLPVYRFYNAAYILHHFTVSEDERTSIIAHPEWGYTDEGVAFYVFSSQ